MGHRRSLLPLALLMLSQVARCYLPPEGPDLRTARIVDPGEYPGAHADLLAVRTCFSHRNDSAQLRLARAQLTHTGLSLQAALRLLEADGRQLAAETYADPHDIAAVHDGLRQASTSAGEFYIELYGSTGTALRNSLSHFFNPETREGLVFPPMGEESEELNPNPEVLLRARWEISLLQGPHPSAVDVVEWEYAKAVAARRAGDKPAAFTALGRAIHLIQGLTVPHHSADLPEGVPGSMKRQYEELCDGILRNSSLEGAVSIHPVSGGIYCDTCPPSEFAETAANQSARFLGTAKQPEAAQTTAVAGVLLAAADKLTAGILHRFHAQWAVEEFAVVKISVERIRALYMYAKKGDEGEHYLLAKGRNRQADFSAVVVIDGEQRRTSTARNCNDVRPGRCAPSPSPPPLPSLGPG